MSRRKFLLMFILLFTTLSSFSHSETISEQKFKELLVHHVSNISDLRRLWSQTRNTAIESEVYLTGGILRGLMHYLHGEVKKNGIAQTWQVRTPSVNELFLQEWSDSDLVAPRKYHDWMRQILPGTWDILDTDFMNDSINSGGATIEKVMVGIRTIRDHDFAIRDYLNGNLVFKLPPNGPNIGNLQGNTRLAQAIRFLRMSQNLPEASITDDSWRKLHGIQISEWNSIQRGLDNDYWILKGLKKLFHSVNRNPETFLELLDRAQLLSLLARHHYSIPEDEGEYNLNAGFKRFMESKGKDWTIDKKLDAAEVLGADLAKKRRLILTVRELDNSEESQTKGRERVNLIQHIVQKFGENSLKQRAANAQNVQHGNIVINGVQVNAAQNGRRLPNGAIEFNVPIQINGVPQKDCARVIVNIAIGQPQIKFQ